MGVAKKIRRTKPATVAEVNAMRTPGRHSVGDSLILSVSESGARSWLARVRDPSGKRRDIGLGPLADVTLADAREGARKLRNASRNNEPILTKAERRKALRIIPTFEEASKRYYEAQKGVWKNGKHVRQWLTTLEAHAFPIIGALPVDKVTQGQVIDLLTPIWNEVPETARRVRQRVLTVINWAHAREFRSTQISSAAISSGLGAQTKAKGNFAALPYNAVPKLMRDLEAGDSIGRFALQFLILTASRSGEVRGASWDEFHLGQKIWTVPGDRMKAGREHVVALSDSAVEIVEKMKELSSSKSLVFPGVSGKQMSDATLAKVLRAAGIGKEQATVHGMRSAFRDWVSEETNFPGDVAEAALAHIVKNKVEAAYRRGNLLAKRHEMMSAWAGYCNGADNVIRMVAL